MKIKVTTRSGSYYHIDLEAGRFQKNNNYWDTHYSITFFRVGDFEDRSPNAFELEAAGSWHDATYPEIGKCMFIQGRGMSDWWATTEVVSIEENPADWPEELDVEFK